MIGRSQSYYNSILYSEHLNLHRSVAKSRTHPSLRPSLGGVQFDFGAPVPVDRIQPHKVDK